MEDILETAKEIQQSTQKKADEAFVFMARAIFKPSLTTLLQNIYQVCEFLITQYLYMSL